jgi:hypothetical protein
MKKISIILSSLLLSCTLTFKDLGAEAHSKKDMLEDKGFPEGMLQLVQVPVYCAPTFELLTSIMDTFGMKYVVSGDVRTGGVPEGSVIGTTSFWYNEKTKTGVMALTMVSNGLTCMMSYGINFKFDEGMMLNIINEELQ